MAMDQSFLLNTCAFLKPALEQTPPVLATNIITCIFDFLVLITATVSNALIIYVIWKDKSLHLPSNTLLGCLAATDFLMGSLVAPLNILTKFGEMINSEEIYCVAGVMYSFIGMPSGTLTFLTLALISVERYLAIRLHLRYATIVSIKTVLRVVAILWLLVFAFAALRFWNTKEIFFRPVLIMGTALFTGVVVFCYGKIFLLVRRHRQQILRQVPSSMNASISVRATNLKDKAEKKTMARQKKCTLNMVYILLFFFLCYFPTFAYQVVAAVVRTGENDQLLRLAYRCVFTLTELKSSLNPVLYCLQIVEIREAVMKVVKKATKRL